MKRIVLAEIAMVMLVCGALTAQDIAPAKKVSDESYSAKALVVFGKVSDDGKKLLTDLDSEWAVANAELLKGNEGRLVRVKCYIDTAANKIQVLWVKRDGESSFVAGRHYGSAFTR